MDWKPTELAYRQTGYFSRIITDYLDGAAALRPFYRHPVSKEGMLASLEARKKFPVDRALLVSALEEQYKAVDQVPQVAANIQKLKASNTFTVVTAHQPAIFTGTLYFIYKILHTIRLTAWLKEQWPENDYIPVFYMGSEDADLDELGKVYLNSEKLVWETRQSGAVGRMKTKGLEKLLDRIGGELSVQPHGPELMEMLKDAYLKSPDIQTATFRLLHHLFAEYGLVVLIPDHEGLKRTMLSVFEEDLLRQTPAAIVEGTIQELSANYKVQANPRPINLFYLKDDLRGRIERTGDIYKVHESSLEFTEAEILAELHAHPQRFSPNVILRGLFQETILPNLAFIGGGGETAYWLELRGLFEHFGVPFPVLVLRNSFLLIQAEWAEKRKRAQVSIADLFQPAEDLINELVKRSSRQQLHLGEEIAEAQGYYQRIEAIAGAVDPTLVQHVEALRARALAPLSELEKKLLKAEKRKFADLKRQIAALKAALFPLNGLQERIDNFMPWYATMGPAFIRDLYQHSLALEQQFVVLEAEL